MKQAIFLLALRLYTAHVSFIALSFKFFATLPVEVKAFISSMQNKPTSKFPMTPDEFIPH
jgi:hypothetical protein